MDSGSKLQCRSYVVVILEWFSTMNRLCISCINYLRDKHT